MLVTGPGLWLASQLLLLLYYKLDNGANTCGIDFHFDNIEGDLEKTEGDLEEVEVNENEESIPLNTRSNSTSRVETEDASEEGLSSSSNKTDDDSKSIINDDESREENYFEFRVLEKLFINKFEVVSEEGK